jgi:DOMON domain
MNAVLRWNRLLLAALAAAPYLLSTASAKDLCFGNTDDAAYLNWVNSPGAKFYNASVCYNATSGNVTDGIALHWKVDAENLYLAVAARATGWVGFGIAETNGMLGADMVIFEAANPGVLRDAHVLDVRMPIDDDCQDWVFKNSTVDDGFIIFEGYRKLDTLDSQDHSILDDSDTLIPPQRILAAWGDDAAVGYHGMNRAQGSLRWYTGVDALDLVHQKLMEQADGFFEMKVPNFTLRAVATDYVSFCFSWEADIVPQGVPADGTIEVIAAEVIFDAESKPFVHHADVTASTIPSNQSRTCLPQGSYGYAIYSWSLGVLPFVLPDNVGYLMGPGGEGEEGGLQSFRLLFHYNNPDLVEGIVDRGGLRVYYTNKKREFELGIMALGDSLDRLKGVPIPSGITQYEFGCLPGCSKLGLDEPITVIQEIIHMHAEGYAAATYHIRDDTVIREARIDYFSFSQAGTLLLLKNHQCLQFSYTLADAHFCNFFHRCARNSPKALHSQSRRLFHFPILFQFQQWHAFWPGLL